jgi:hypothetical protein
MKYESGWLAGLFHHDSGVFGTTTIELISLTEYHCIAGSHQPCLQ